MLFVVCCSWFVVCGVFLCVVCCSLCVECCLLVVGCSCLLLCVVRYSVLFVGRLVFSASCMYLVCCFLMLVACCL